MKIGEEVYPNMAIETIRVAVGDPSYQVKADETGIVAMRVPAYATINTDTNARVWVRWNKEFKTMSAASEDFTPLAGTTVIVAMTAEGLGGVVATPVGEQYDYVISAQTLQTILDGETIKRYDSLIEILAGFVLGILIILITRFTPYWIIGVSLLGIFGGGIYYFQHMFSTQLVLVDITWALLTFFIVGFHATFNRFILEFRQKQQIKKQFEHYLDPRQVKALQKNPDLLKLGGERKDMSYLFMDIIGFTPISEYYKNKDDPEGLVVLVNEFLDDMTNIILNNGGMVDKFMGDCIMAVFGAPLDMPNHAEMAVKSAVEIEAKTLELKQRYKDRGLPDINVGTGVNTGPAIIGNMGSSTRFDFSVIGDAVNLAARLEATAGRGDYLQYPTIYSSMTMTQLPDDMIIRSHKIGDIRVKGKEDVIEIYNLVP
jgi:adenylate cyclase